MKIQSGEDIRHLGELDEKMWTVLSCPTVGLEIDETSLKLIDTDNDGKLHVQEVVKTANWLCATLTNPDILLKGEAQLNVVDIVDESIRSVAEKIATDGVITLDAVRAAIGAVTVEAQAVPEAPYSGEITAAYKACKDAYAQYFATARMQALGLATLPADAAVPGMTEEAFGEMGKKIADYEAEKAAIEGANAKLLADAQAQYRPLEKLLLLTRDFYALLRNYVSFQDFYAKRGKALLGRAAKGETPWAIFQATPGSVEGLLGKDLRDAWKDARVFKSAFLAPAYTNLALGIDCKPTKWLSINLAPLTGGFVIVKDMELREKYSMGLKKAYNEEHYDSLPENEKAAFEAAKNDKGANPAAYGAYLRGARFEFGAQLKTDAKVNVNDKFSYSTQVVVFVNYLDINHCPRINWDNRIDWKLAKYFSLTVTTNMIYDDQIMIFSDKDNLTKARIQFKESIAFGFTYTIASRK